MAQRANAIFSLRYAGSVGYYAAMLRFRKVALDTAERYDKRRKWLNRMEIAGANGRLSLSVPLRKPNRLMAVGEVEVAEHANWRHNHWGALFSAYGRSPFFDYFADDLKAIYDNPATTTIAALDEAIHRAVVDFLAIDVETVVLGGESAADAAETPDFRDSLFSGDAATPPYYQVWAAKRGFEPGLSILDLLFNVGREAVFYLR